MSNILAPNGNYSSYEYAGLDGVFRPLIVTAASTPQAMQIEKEDQTVRGNVRGALKKSQPLPTGSLTMLDIAPTPTSYTPRQHVVEGLGGFNGTNSTLTLDVDTSDRLVTIKQTWNNTNLQMPSYYVLWTGVDLMFPASPSEADSGNTLEVPIKIYGTLGQPVFI
tara:strand:+ start:632 stop:1126 length:495 start_codon:yes stop_codon:yes gene_type:complete